MLFLEVEGWGGATWFVVVVNVVPQSQFDSECFCSAQETDVNDSRSVHLGL